MRKPSAKVARIAVVALAIPLFGGFATYAAAQVSTKPAPQVVIPGRPGTDDKGAPKSTVQHVTATVSDDRVGHDANDDKGKNVTSSTVAEDNRGRDTNDDHGGTTPATVSDDPANHDANDDHGGVTPATVSDDPANHDATDDHGVDATTPATSTTPTSVDDHGGKSGGSGSGHHGADG